MKYNCRHYVETVCQLSSLSVFHDIAMKLINFTNIRLQNDDLMFSENVYLLYR